jgi:hypothetical protein
MVIIIILKKTTWLIRNILKCPQDVVQSSEITPNYAEVRSY